MGEIKKQLSFQAPVEKVWEIWTDVEKTPEWVEGVQESQITSPVKEGRGLEWKEKCQFGKQMIQMDHMITTWEPLKKTVTKTGLPMGGTMETAAEFSSTPEGTKVDLQVEWDLGMVTAFIGEEKLQHMMEKSFDATISRWKEKAEKS